MDVSIYQKSKKGNYLCGDSYFCIEDENMFLGVLADGLGSGGIAKESSQAVVEIIKDHLDRTVEELIRLCNKKLVKMRGAVVGILKIDFKNETYTFSSIGNIGVIILEDGAGKKRNIPNAGYLGTHYRAPKVMTEKVMKGTNFIMFSDGVMDKELSQGYFKDTDVDRITDAYAYLSDSSRNDDTTLMAIRYRNEQG